MMSDFEKIVRFISAYDRKDEGYGIGAVELLMVLKGDLGATQFRLYTGWYLPESMKLEKQENSSLLPAYSYLDYSRAICRNDYDGKPTTGLIPSDLGYHSPKPHYEGHEAIQDRCEFVPGDGPCYYDGSTLNAWRPFEALLRKGDEGVWEVLEEFYHQVFEGEEVTA